MIKNWKQLITLSSLEQNIFAKAKTVSYKMRFSKGSCTGQAGKAIDSSLGNCILHRQGDSRMCSVESRHTAAISPFPRIFARRPENIDSDII